MHDACAPVLTLRATAGPADDYSGYAAAGFIACCREVDVIAAS
jgi:hypothetical protein